MHRRIFATCLLLALLAFGAVGCESIGLPGIAAVDGRSTLVELDASGRVEDDVLVVEGTATVPDGALVTIMVMPVTEDGQLIQTTRAQDVVEVRDGAFVFRVPVEGWDGTKLNTWVAFYTTIAKETDAGTIEQTAEVIRLYGEKGENIEGETRQMGDVAVVEAAFMVER